MSKHIFSYLFHNKKTKNDKKEEGWYFELNISIQPGNLRLSDGDFFSNRPTTNTIVKLSPAPIVSSTIGARIASCIIGGASLVTRIDPCPPYFTIT